MRFIRDREVQALRSLEGPMSDKKKEKQEGQEGQGRRGGRRARSTVSISAHPRARAGIRRARTRAAFLAFVARARAQPARRSDRCSTRCGARCWPASWSTSIVWRCAIVVWRHIILSELRQVEERRAERRREERERLEAQAAETASNFRTA